MLSLHSIFDTSLELYLDFEIHLKPNELVFFYFLSNVLNDNINEHVIKQTKVNVIIEFRNGLRDCGSDYLGGNGPTIKVITNRSYQPIASNAAGG